MRKETEDENQGVKWAETDLTRCRRGELGEVESWRFRKPGERENCDIVSYFAVAKAPRV